MKHSRDRGRTTSMLRTHCDPRRCKREPVPIRDPRFPGQKCADPPLEAFQRGFRSRSDPVRDSPGASRERPGLGQPLRNRAGCLVVSHGSSASRFPAQSSRGAGEPCECSPRRAASGAGTPRAALTAAQPPRVLRPWVPGEGSGHPHAPEEHRRLTPGAARPARSAWGAARTRAARAARPRDAPPRAGCVDVRGG